MRGVLDTLCDKVCQWLAAGREGLGSTIYFSNVQMAAPIAVVLRINIQFDSTCICTTCVAMMPLENRSRFHAIYQSLED